MNAPLPTPSPAMFATRQKKTDTDSSPGISETTAPGPRKQDSKPKTVWGKRPDHLTDRPLRDHPGLKALQEEMNRPGKKAKAELNRLRKDTRKPRRAQRP